MKFLDLLKSEENIELDKKTLVILRWIAITGQFITINFVYFVLNFDFPYFYCSLLIFLGVITNIFLQFRIKKKLLSNFAAAAYLSYDLIQLAALVFFTGGITNPFVILLVIPAVVSSTFFIVKEHCKFVFYNSCIIISFNTLSFSSPTFC